MAAVTSYVLLDFADEIIAQQPDAVVIYTGHNEYLGIGGVGSSLRQREVADAGARRARAAPAAPVPRARAAVRLARRRSRRRWRAATAR